MAVIIVDHTFLGNKTLDDLSLWVTPITLHNGEKKRTIQMLLDTGAQRTVISFDAQELLNLPTRGESLRGSGITGNSQYMVQNLDRLEIGSIVFSDIEILIGQLPKPFSRYQIDGILGGDILKNLTLILNYPEKRLRIEKQIVSC